MTQSKELERLIEIIKEKHIMTQGYCDTDAFVVIPIKELAQAILKDYIRKSEVDKLRKELDDAKTDYENCKDHCYF